jgi:hypothetical protein
VVTKPGDHLHRIAGVHVMKIVDPEEVEGCVQERAAEFIGSGHADVGVPAGAKAGPGFVSRRARQGSSRGIRLDYKVASGSKCTSNRGEHRPGIGGNENVSILSDERLNGRVPERQQSRVAADRTRGLQPSVGNSLEVNLKSCHPPVALKFGEQPAVPGTEFDDSAVAKRSDDVRKLPSGRRASPMTVL